ncbi:MAG TPA: hypothetical protein VFA71_14450 [Terriglobales bacterium]|nr:hypothetical protein [Terriglobales bacterium]
MNSEDQKHAAEQWLNDALAHYGVAEPRAGLETRILANLDAHVSQRRRRWIFALAASAAVVVVFAMLMANVRGSRQDAPNHVARQTPPLEIKSANATQAAAIQRQRENLQLSAQRHATVHKPAAFLRAVGMKQESLPVVRPLSEQVAEQRPAPSINISDLKTIQAIEVRELTPIKEID